MSISIREANLNDVAAIADFQVRMAMETEDKKLDSAVVNTAVEAVFADATKGFYIVGESEGIVVSSLLVTYEWSDWRNCNMWYIQSVYVTKEHRAKGAFKNMYQRVLEMAKKDGSMYVRLYVEVENIRAQKTYEALGMKRMPYYMYDVEV